LCWAACTGDPHAWLQCKECASQLILDGNKVLKKQGIRRAKPFQPSRTHVGWRHQLFLVPATFVIRWGREARSGRLVSLLPLTRTPPAVLPLQASGSFSISPIIEGYFYLHRHTHAHSKKPNKKGSKLHGRGTINSENEASMLFLARNNVSVCHDFMSCLFLLVLILRQLQMQLSSFYVLVLHLFKGC